MQPRQVADHQTFGVDAGRLLVLVVLPTRPATWAELVPDGLLLRRRAFWVSLAGRPAVDFPVPDGIGFAQVDRATGLRAVPGGESEMEVFVNELGLSPLDASRPWNTRDVVGVNRFLQRLWRSCVDESTGESRVVDVAIDDDTRRVLHRTIAAITRDIPALGFNTVVARLFELNNHLTKLVEASGSAPREVVEPLILMTSPVAPHIAEELWQRIGHHDTCAYEPFPVHDPNWLIADTVVIPVQINGKVRAKVTVAADANQDVCEAAARADDRISALLDGATVRKTVVVPGRMVNFVIG